MPFKPHEMGAHGPQVPHLAVLTDESGEVMAMPPGAIIYIIEDQTNPQKIFPMALVKVSRKQIQFKCVCHDPNCTRKFSYNLTGASGHHETEQSRTAARVKGKLTS